MEKYIFLFHSILHVTLLASGVGSQQSDCVKSSALSIGVCPTQPAINTFRRRYDINDLGYPNLFHGWVDVQGVGAATDYCRIVGNSGETRVACALGGTHGQNEYAYDSALKFPIGHTNTWYMRDEDGDGRDDYCRCLGDDPKKSQVICTKAGEKGFYGSILQGGRSQTFSPTGPIDCKLRIVFPEFGRVYGSVGPFNR